MHEAQGKAKNEESELVCNSLLDDCPALRYYLQPTITPYCHPESQKGERDERP
jgi:hypothetical protein